MRERLDHRYLNEIEGLESPSLERIARFVWNALKPRFEGLSRVIVRRDAHRHGCVYTGEPVADEAPRASTAERIAHA